MGSCQTEIGVAGGVEEHQGIIEGRLVMDLYFSDYVRLVQTATFLLGDRQAAEDVVQEAFVRLDRRIGRLGEISQQRAYVRQVVVNLSRSALRRRVVALKHAPRPVSPSPGADAEVMAALARDDMMTALRRLPARQRQAVVLRFYEDLTEAEIADAMGCKLGTVKATLSQAKRSLASLLDDDWEDRQ
jgi:RNA polymerase sigma-70 factor (sigma-E family)